MELVFPIFHAQRTRFDQSPLLSLVIIYMSLVITGARVYIYTNERSPHMCIQSTATHPTTPRVPWINSFDSPCWAAWLFHITRIPQFNSLRTSIINGVGWPPEKKLKEIPQKCLHSVKAKYFIDTHMPTPHRIANPLRTTEPPNHPSSQSTSDLIRMLTTAGDGEKGPRDQKPKGAKRRKKLLRFIFWFNLLCDKSF